MRRIEVILLLATCTLPGCHRYRQPALALEECDPAGYIGCIQPSAYLSLPITDTNLFLTYSSRWRPGKAKQPAWDAASLGLGGWSINLVQRYDPANKILISGDGTWRLADSVALPNGEHAVPSYDGAVAYVFDSAGRHVRTVDGRLGAVLLTVSYDGAGRLLQLKGSANGQPVRVLIQRDRSGAPRALVGMDGGRTDLALDTAGRLVGISSPAPEMTRIGWNSAGMVESETDPARDVTRFTYDSSGQLASATDADGITRRYQGKSSASSLEIRISTPLNRSWTYRAEFTRAGIRRTFIQPDGTKSTQSTDSHGNRTVMLADGTTWNIAAVRNAVWGMAAPILTPVVETRADGVISRREVKYALRPQSSLPYVLAGSVATIINGQPWTQNFDPLRHTAELVDPAGRRSVWRYDESGRLLSYFSPGVPSVAYAYSAEGRPISQTVGTGKVARTMHYTYDTAKGQIIVTRPDGTVEKNAVDRAGRTVTASAGDGSTVVISYDPAGRVNQIQPAGGVKFTLGLSPAGRPTAFAPPMVQGDASIEITSYNKDGQPAAISGLGNRAVSYAYDSAGKIISINFDQGQRALSYDSRSGLISQASDPSGVKTSYGYKGSTQTSVRWSGPVSGSVSVALDADGHASYETVNGSNNLQFTYDAAGNLSGVGPLSLTRDSASGLVTRTVLGAIETKRQYDENSQLIRLTATAKGKLIFDLRYTRDSAGRIKIATEAAAGGKPSTTEYAYDRADRLASVRVNGHIAEINNYDPAGNRIAIGRSTGKVKGNYDARGRLLSLGATQYTWMPDGTLAGIAQGQRASAFVYDDFGALRQASLPNGRKVQYLIDADGRRVGREVAGRLVAAYLYRLDGSLAAETDGAGKIVARFGYDDRGHLALVERGGVTYRVVTDEVGSPRLVVDSRTGGIVAQIAYDPWGNIMQDTAPGFIPIGFAGGLGDPDTGLIRFGARDYDPRAGRWTAADPIRFSGGDANLYRYAGGDSVNFFDPTGLGSCAETGRSSTCYDNSQQGNGWLPYPTNMGNQPGWCTPSGLCIFGPPQGYGNPPQNANPPQNGNPPPPSGPQWSCSGIACQGPNGDCAFASCGNGPNGFWCTGVACNGPDRDCAFCSIGEPHLFRAPAAYFDFQAAGEFLVARNPEGTVLIEGRQQPWGDSPVAINTAVAADLNGDRVSVYAKEPAFLLVNNREVSNADWEERLAHGGTVVRHGGMVNLIWPDGSKLQIISSGGALNYGFFAGPGTALNLRGLLGSTPGTSPAELLGRDGTVLKYSDPEFHTKLYRQYGNSWRIRQPESLFHYWPGESTEKFTDLSFPRKYVSVAMLSSAERSRGETACQALGIRRQPALDDCILDVSLTGMPAFAVASVGIPENAPGSFGAGGASAASATPAPSVAAREEFAIKVGDIVSPGHPAKGAGIISRTGEKQVYSFAGQAGGVVYVKVGPCDGAVPSFEVRQRDDKVIGGRIGCGDFGPVTLPTAGTYRIMASADGPSAHYSFSLRPAAFDQYSIKIGDTVSPNHPAQGAGIIKDLGQKQSYSFSGRAGEVIYVALGPCEGAQPSFDLRDPDDKYLGGVIGNCTVDIGRLVLPATGNYRITAATDKSNVASRYNFFVHTVPPDHHFQVHLPFTVAPGVPGRGAGHVSAAGEQQFYDFTATPGATVHIEGKCGGSCPKLSIRAAKAGDTGDYAFWDLNFTHGDWKLPAGGKYTIQVRSNRYVGDYSFSATQGQVQRH